MDLNYINVYSSKNPDSLITSFKHDRLAHRPQKPVFSEDCLFFSTKAVANKNNNGVICLGDPDQADEWLKAWDTYERCRLGDNLTGMDIRYKLWKDKMSNDEGGDEDKEEEKAPMT